MEFLVKSRLDALNKNQKVYRRSPSAVPAPKHSPYVGVSGWKLPLLCAMTRCHLFEVVLLPFQRCLASKGTNDRCMFVRSSDLQMVQQDACFSLPLSSTHTLYVCVCVCVEY